MQQIRKNESGRKCLDYAGVDDGTYIQQQWKFGCIRKPRTQQHRMNRHVPVTSSRWTRLLAAGVRPSCSGTIGPQTSIAVLRQSEDENQGGTDIEYKMKMIGNSRQTVQATPDRASNNRKN